MIHMPLQTFSGLFFFFGMHPETMRNVFEKRIAKPSNKKQQPVKRKTVLIFEQHNTIDERRKQHPINNIALRLRKTGCFPAIDRVNFHKKVLKVHEKIKIMRLPWKEIWLEDCRADSGKTNYLG